MARRDFSFPAPQEKALERELSQFRGKDREQRMEAYAKKRCFSRDSVEGDAYNWQDDPLEVCQIFDSFNETDPELSNEEGSVPPQEQKNSRFKGQLNRSVPQKRSDPRLLNKSIPG